ncbi:MAG: TIGR02449 family protein [Lysobacterales bacterium]
MSRVIMAERLAVEGELRSLAEKLERLLNTNARLFEENRSLRAAQEQLAQERATLLAKNEQARSRVEAMITRLKAMEQNG